MALIAALPLALLLLIEGCASLALFVSDLRAGHEDDRVHTTWDADLGWASRRGFSDADYYGRGVGLRIDERGVRFGLPRADSAGAARRALCLGDSFTFGHGVADAQTWCALLAAGTPPLRTVNMGQVGYGIDQMFLWYRRDGRASNPDLVILGFIRADLERMKRDWVGAARKPILALDGDSVVARGQPVPRPSKVAALMNRLYEPTRGVRLIQVAERLKGPARAPAAERDSADEHVWTLFRRVVSSIARNQAAHGGQVALVLIPAQADFTGTTAAQWRARLRELADSVPVIDLVGELRALPPDSVPPLYLQASDRVPHRAAGHFSAAGNAWAAERIRAALRARGLLSAR